MAYMSQMSHVSQMTHMFQVFKTSEVFQMSHVSQMSMCPMCPKCLMCPKCPMCPKFPPCVPNVQCVTNVLCDPNVLNVTCVKKNKALQILVENISAMANINYIGGKSHLLWLPHCTQRWGHVGSLLPAQCVLSVCLSHSFLSVCPALSIVQAVKQETLTQCWANVGPLSTTLSQYWPLGQYWVTVLCLAPL